MFGVCVVLTVVKKEACKHRGLTDISFTWSGLPLGYGFQSGLWVRGQVWWIWLHGQTAPWSTSAEGAVLNIIKCAAFLVPRLPWVLQ